MVHTLAFGMPGMGEWIVIGIIGLLLFGKRLPEVGRSLGKGIVEFKKGLKGVEDDIERSSTEEQPKAQPTLPEGAKFDPYTGKPVAQTEEPSPASQATTPPPSQA